MTRQGRRPPHRARRARTLDYVVLIALMAALTVAIVLSLGSIVHDPGARSLPCVVSGVGPGC